MTQLLVPTSAPGQSSFESNEVQPLLQTCPSSSSLPVYRDTPSRQNSYVLLLGAGFLYAVCNIFTAAYQQLPDASISILLLLRGIVFVIFSIPTLLFCSQKDESCRSTTSHDLHETTTLPFAQLAFRGFLIVWQAVAWSLSVWLFILAIDYIPVGDIAAITSICPVFTILFATVFLKEPFRRYHLVAVLLSFVGAVLIAKGPDMDISASSTITDNSNPVSDAESSENAHVIGVVISLLSALLFAGSIVSMRGLRSEMSPSLSVFSIGVATILIPLCDETSQFMTQYLNGTSSSSTWDPKWMTNQSNIGLLFAVLAAMAALLGQFCLSAGISGCEVGPASLLLTTEVPFTYLMAIGFLHQGVAKSSVGGAVLIVSSVMFVTLLDGAQKHKTVTVTVVQDVHVL